MNLLKDFVVTQIKWSLSGHSDSEGQRDLGIMRLQEWNLHTLLTYLSSLYREWGELSA